jgi:ribulose 1,5-bisphosphate synthetase/thiazole synthase
VTTSATGSLRLDPLEPAGPAELDGLPAIDVAVIAGGIAGLTTAPLLERGGARVAVIKAERAGHGVTGCNTAKVTLERRDR